MKQSISALFLFILTGCFISCEKDIEFKGEVTDPLLVLNGILTPDSAVSVHLSQSRFILGEMAPFNPISNAMVSLFVNGGLKEQLTYGVKGTYTSTYFPKPGDEIKLEVVADGYDLVKSQTAIPGNPCVAVTDSTVTIRKEEYSNPYQPNAVQKTTTRSMQVQLKLTDASQEENYYFIKCTKNYYRNNELLMVLPIELKLSEVLKNNITDNGNIFQDLFGDEGKADRTDNLFSDLFVNGKDILFDFLFYDTLEFATYINGEKIDNENGEEQEMTVEYMIEIGEISRDLYLYVISGNKAVNAGDVPFTEPVQVHSNIENGIGILGAYNSYRFISRFQTKYYPYYSSL